MAVMPLVPETNMADVAKLISLGNLLARKTTWLLFTITSETSNLSRFFGDYCWTSIVYKYSHLPTPLSSTFSLTESTHSFPYVFKREHFHSLHFD